MAHPDRSDLKVSSIIKRYIDNVCRKINRNNSTASSPSINHFFKEGKLFIHDNLMKITKEFLEEQILKFFVSGNIAFNQADNEHFRTLMSFIPINNKPAISPDRTILHTRLSKYAKLSEEQLKELLKNNQFKISLALNC